MSSTYSYCLRGKTTARKFFYALSAIPAPLLDPNGNVLEISNGAVTLPDGTSEYLVLASQAGQLRRGTHGPNTDDQYSPGFSPSPWESITGTTPVAPANPNGGGFGIGPFAGEIFG
jgi:hypothetical protein